MIGMWYSAALVRRVTQLETLDRFILALSEEMRFTGANHIEIINRLISFDTYTAINNIKEKSQDGIFLKEFINGLGKSDMEGQLTYCSTARLRLKSIINSAVEERDAKSKLYKILGVSLGAMFTVLIV